jgi:putative oxidoreductase
MKSFTKEKRHLHISPQGKIAISNVIACLFIFLFVYTAVNKIWKFHNFNWVLGTLPVIGSYNSLIAYFVPTAELITTLLLFNTQTRKYGFISSFLLMLVFSGYLIFMVLFTRDLPCNCGGVLSHLSWRQHIAFNLFFLLLSIITLKFQTDLRDKSHH